MIRFWRVFWFAEILGAGLIYVLHGEFDSIFSQSIVASQALVLFICALHHMKNVEGRDPGEFIRFSLLIWVAAWVVEFLALKTGFLGAYYHYKPSRLLSFGSRGVPIIVPTAWLIFSVLDSSISHFLFENFKVRQRAPWRPWFSLLVKSCLSGWVMLSLGFSVEWHFSQIARFWNWRPVGDAVSVPEGVPAGNFILWFSFGLLLPLFERITHTPKFEYKSPGFFRQASPSLGFGILLSAGLWLNLANNFFLGAVFCSVSLVLLASFLISFGQIRARRLRESLARGWKISRVSDGLP
jgi:Carotenoid biosynthesis protein